MVAGGFDEMSYTTRFTPLTFVDDVVAHFSRGNRKGSGTSRQSWHQLKPLRGLQLDSRMSLVTHHAYTLDRQKHHAGLHTAS